MMQDQNFHKKSCHNKKYGFTLVEVMISLTIVTLIMGVILFNYSTFNDNLALSAAMQETSLVIRKAQTYGLSVKEVVVGGGQFNSAYGVKFDGPGGVNLASSFIFFVDKSIPKNGVYDAG